MGRTRQSPRALPSALPACFPRRLRSILELREETIERFIRKLMDGGGWTRAQLICALAGRNAAPPELIGQLSRLFDESAWRFLIGEEPTLHAPTHESAA